MAKWTVRDEIKLLQAMRNSKPVGMHKHFAIIGIVEELKDTLNRAITISQVWEYIQQLYNISALDEFETTPFPNEVTDFCLPENDYPETMSDAESEADQRTAPINDANVLDVAHDVSIGSAKNKTTDRSFANEKTTPRRVPKRTRAALQQDSSSNKRRRF
ncbi:MRG/MORF4L-binding protein-like [Watersipora subatra]|uniref:MRG/MORF4L-binding protein-like n=1 Tax=Watersipora subatra TaxID=2589382 RepID=UPI00355C6DD4